ncbi:MAG: GDP-mannose 4,6-dehydratase [Acidobacteriota bacterium]|nr:MAG: GDP-mannose 4,6-dehydratase [Acidobacteriota bacterium]
MNVLITGGAGFIGSHLAEHYLKQGHKVTVLDNLSTGSMQNIEALKKKPNFEYVIDSIMNRPVLAELVDLADVVFHLAAAVGVRLIVESPVNTIETNIKGTEVILELANHKKKKVLIASTSEVYGKNSKVPFVESDDMVLGPSNKSRWSYACSKAIDEFLALAYWKEKKLPVVIARIFNTVGPRQTGRYGMVIPTFAKQALQEKPITVFGDGTQSRSFLHVHDGVQALSALMESDKTVGAVINVGHNTEIAILELARQVKSVAGSRSEIKLIPYDEAYEEGFEDMHRRVPSIEKAHRLIGFEPTKNVEEILRDVVEYFRNGDIL